MENKKKKKLMPGGCRQVSSHVRVAVRSASRSDCCIMTVTETMAERSVEEKKELDMKKNPFYCTKRLKKAYKITQTYTNTHTHTHRKDDRTDDATEARNRGSKLLLSPIMGNIYENLFIDFLLYCQSLSGCPTFYIHTHTHTSCNDR